ncbi:tyrosyl-tRNA synthetase [Uncinocarpus reesii 1704]|uniref:Tyrosine--tRNA ligase n=1 Tax=Uncinocarpus reesii (strain UAMH 1704) TaxID=336963 RepID=C4JFW3_UNCRE|nr:tyrosyl-tRNA synthetase [Uncinocarpus reesii 1704]EEP76194.1 tyrosyl-tRNA synthetase [Uncinocarpus reesii 1704]
MALDLSPQEKLDLIKLNLQEVLKPEILEDVIVRQNRPLTIYWGTATTGRPHCGYFVPIVKLAHFLRAGCHIKILLADIHGFLDNLKAPIELVNFRADYYRYVITALLEAVHVPTDKLEFVLGSSYQLSAKYTMDLFRLSSVVTEHDAKKAGAEVVKQVENAVLSGLIYPLMQALDEEHLGVDAQFGGVDQRKIFTLAMETLPRIGYKERAHLMNPMVPGLAGGKMSASDPDSKIDILDTPDAVKKKLRKAYAMPKETEGNGIISFVEYVLLPVSALESADGTAKFVVDRREEEGGPLVYNNIDALKADYIADTLTPQLLKAATTTALNKILAPVQAAFQANPAWQEIEKKAYPPPEPEKKKKKVRDKGSRYPGGGKGIVAQPDGSVKGPGSKEVSVGTGVEDAMEKLDV